MSLRVALAAIAVLWISASPATASEAPGFFVRLTQDIQAWQGELYRNLAGGLRAIREEGSVAALSALLSTSFLYGVLHAAGPGHGKVVLSAYLAAGPRRMGEGLVLAFLSATAQAVTAILAVGFFALVLGFVAKDVLGAAYWLERASFVLIAALGLYLIARAVWPRVFGLEHAHDHHVSSGPKIAADTETAKDRESHAGHHHGHRHGPDCTHGAGHADHAPVAPCGHVHAPLPEKPVRSLAEAAAVIGTIGLRPCSGALLLLIFALANGLFWAGVLGTFAMALGTAITVAAIALTTVLARSAAERLAKTATPGWVDNAMRGLSIAAGLFLIWVGVALALSPAQPFVPGSG